MDRISRDEITGFTSTHALSNVAHRLMTYEAAAKWSGAARRTVATAIL